MGRHRLDPAAMKVLSSTLYRTNKEEEEEEEEEVARGDSKP